MARNRKSVVNDDRVETVQYSWFTVPFIRGITEKFSKLNNERMRVLFYCSIEYAINCDNSLGYIKAPLPRDKKLFIRSRIRVAMQIMWDRRVDS